MELYCSEVMSQAINPQTLVLHNAPAAINIPETRVGGYEERLTRCLMHVWESM